jgi:hypothetical protein
VTSREQLIKARLGILVMAAQIKNVAKVCKLTGMSRSQFYALKKAYETSGEEGLAPRARRKPQMPNRTPVPVENRILLKTHDNPIASYVRLAGELQSEGVSVTPGMVRYVWLRHGLSKRSARLRWKRRKGQACAPQPTHDNIVREDQSRPPTLPASNPPSVPGIASA